MSPVFDWYEKIKLILTFIKREKIAYAEITLTVKGGDVVFVDYRGPLKLENKEEF